MASSLLTLCAALQPALPARGPVLSGAPGPPLLAAAAAGRRGRSPLLFGGGGGGEGGPFGLPKLELPKELPNPFGSGGSGGSGGGGGSGGSDDGGGGGPRVCRQELAH